MPVSKWKYGGGVGGVIGGWKKFKEIKKYHFAVSN